MSRITPIESFYKPTPQFEVAGSDSKHPLREDAHQARLDAYQPPVPIDPDIAAIFASIDTLPTPVAVVEQTPDASEVKARARHRKVGGGLIALVRGR